MHNHDMLDPITPSIDGEFQVTGSRPIYSSNDEGEFWANAKLYYKNNPSQNSAYETLLGESGILRMIIENQKLIASNLYHKVRYMLSKSENSTSIFDSHMFLLKLLQRVKDEPEFFCEYLINEETLCLEAVMWSSP